MIKPLLVATICAAICGCAQVDDDRIPAMPVSINLTDQGMWNVYGVSGTGMSRRFVKELGERPASIIQRPPTPDSEACCFSAA